MFDTLYDANTGLDRGIQFGDGHFTTLVFKHGQPQLWSYHKRRLLVTSERLGMRLGDACFNDIAQAVFKTCEKQQNGVMKVIVTRGNSQQGYRLPEQASPNWYLTTSPLPTRFNSSCHVGFADMQLGEQPLLAGLKTLNRLEQVMLHKERAERGFDDLIVCSSTGYVIEAIQGNLFWRRHDRWFTPKLERCGIAGILRQAILDQGLLPSVSIVEEELTDLTDINAMLIVNSVRGVIPVSQIHDKVIDNTIPADLKAFTDETCA
ncbi:MAG TPA: aminodeoxychorismate lyase [Idiomarina baltica]|uniref:Aminodeoxychorismate lyase n=1 Tax=Idiomarina baltica TaxID=190892 RepID=A0A348WPJ9_9GAMM|nr:aminodeoxychorismate lyase [Idiomarina baltica]